MKKYRRVFAMLMALMIINGYAFAADFKKALKPVAGGIESFLTPILFIVGAAGTLYCVTLGVKFSKAEEPQDREKAKSHLTSAIIGFLIIFLLIVGLKLAMPALTEWMDDVTKESSSSAS